MSEVKINDVEVIEYDEVFEIEIYKKTKKVFMELHP
jgi:hypothetical protein